MSRRRKQSRSSLVAGGVLTLLLGVPLVLAAVDAPTGFDNLTNGFESQTNFDLDRAQFDTVKEIADGLGPVYNAQACRECHQNPVSGSEAQINELRAGRIETTGTAFTPHPGGSLVNDRAINAAIQETIFDSDNVRAFRTALNVLGDGFVEALPDSEFTRVQAAQPAAVKGTIVTVQVLEASTTTPFLRIARFGWKNQHASLLSFSADASLNEIGITNPLFPDENTSNGNSVAAFDTVPDPEDPATSSHTFGEGVEAFARFMRSTKAPPRAPTTSSDTGEEVFDRIGCENCHTDSFTTAPEGTSFNGGTFIVPAALGSKTIHPYGDFMLHDIGTGDRIPQASATGAQIRTAPLWGLRTRTRLMHDGQSLTIRDAILRHDGQAASSVTAFKGLSKADDDALMAFLKSL